MRVERGRLWRRGDFDPLAGFLRSTLANVPRRSRKPGLSPEGSTGYKQANAIGRFSIVMQWQKIGTNLALAWVSRRII